MKKMIAYCGLDCEQCDAYLATVRDDPEMRERIAAEWSALNGVTILPRDINCAGCRASGIKTVFCDRLCPIRRCAMKKGLETCGDCPEMETCEALGTVLANNEAARENLKKQDDPAGRNSL